MKIKEVDSPKAVVVIIHGAFEHSGRYDWVVEQFNHLGYHVVYGDLPGQGENIGKKKGHIDRFQQYIDTVKDWVGHAKTYDLPIFLFGHSMGGLTAIRLVQTENVPLDGVILSSPALGLKTGPEKVLKVIAGILDKITPRLTLKTGVHSSAATRNQALVKKDDEDPLFVRKVSVRWFMEFEKSIEKANKDKKKYRDIPTLMLQSGTDKLVDQDASIDWFNQLQINEKKIKVYEDLYHELLNEPEQDEVMEEIRQFIEGRIKSLTVNN